MKKLSILLLFVALSTSIWAQESGIKFFKGTWNEAVELAKKEKKNIFVDFYTEWCGPCLNMALNTFVLPEVGEIYNKNFVCVKIDAEKGEGAELAKRYAVHSYPTYVFINPKNQEMIHRSGGNKPAADFIADVKGALNPKLSSIYLNKKYQSGDYDIAFLKDYIRGQKTSGNRDLGKYFEEILAKGGKLTDKDIWDLYCECITGYNNPYVKQISDNYAQFTQLFGKKAVDEKLAEATAYAPVSFTETLNDFEGKTYNIKMKNLTNLFNAQNYDEAFAMTDELIADTTIDQNKLIKQLSFYVRVIPKRDEDKTPFELLAKKVGYIQYIAYNTYDRDEAMPHYNYAAAMEYLIQRAQQEGKQIPAYLFDTPKYGKKQYDMRHPLLKAKPKRK